jgi:hypothetical protein
VRPFLTRDNLHLESETVLVLTVPPHNPSYYEILAPETLTVSIPAAALRTRQAIVGAPTVHIIADPGSLEIDFGTAGYVSEDGQLSVQETTLRGFQSTITLKLEGDEWDEPVASNRSDWTDVLNGMFTDQPSALSGWRSLIITRLREQVGFRVQRASNTELNILIPETPAYGISTPETITVSLPAAAVRTRNAYIHAGSFVLRAVQSEMLVGGASLDEEMLRTCVWPCVSWVPRKVTYTLAIGRGRFWNTDIDNPVSEARQALLDELISQNDVDEPLGFTAMIKPYLAPENSWQLELDDYDGLADGLRNSLSLRFFSYENYNITAPET